MKRRISLIALIAFTAGAMVFTGCKKDDTTAPSITVTGGDQTVSLNSTYTDAGATATDDEDGDLSSSVSSTGTVNTNQTGTYTIQYSVSDAAGNTANATRTVTVVNDADQYSGTYNATETCQVSTVNPYTSAITASQTVNNKITIVNFGGFYPSLISAPANIQATVSGSNLTFTLPQTIGSTGSLIAASGTINGNVITVTYTWNDGSSNETCTTTYTKQ